MKNLLQLIPLNSRYIKAIEWSRLVVLTGVSQAIVQAAGLITGIIVIRLLPTQEYALYTLTNAVLSSIVIMADSGINIGVMSEGGKVWENDRELGAVLSTGLDLRKKFAVGSLIIFTPILAYLLLQHGASKLVTFAIVLAIIPSFLASITDSVYEIVPKLHQDIKALQKNQVTVSIIRIVLNSITLLVAPFAFVIVFVSAIPRIYGNIQIKKLAYSKASKAELPDSEVKERILRIVKRSIPGLVYFCLTGQLTIWLISFFGQTKSIATVGAISRLTMGISLFSGVFTMLIIPRFARLPNDKDVIRTYFIRVQLLLIAIVSMIMLITWVGSKELLWIIGPNYSGLDTELLMAMLSSCIMLLLGCTYSLYSTKGWVMHPAYSISVSVLLTIAGVIFFNISTLKGVFLMNIFVASVEYVNCLLYSIVKINKIEELI
jgi:O-antigen/teichoic acid export membrane protein